MEQVNVIFWLMHWPTVAVNKVAILIRRHIRRLWKRIKWLARKLKIKILKPIITLLKKRIGMKKKSVAKVVVKKVVKKEPAPKKAIGKLKKDIEAGKKAIKIGKVMHEYKEGKLHSESKKGPKVTSKKQALAIALSEARRLKKKPKAK